MTIGDKIRKLRVERHITQEILAKYLNISYQAISKWEQNITSPDLSIIPDIAEYFEITTDELLGVNTSKQKDPYTRLEKLLSLYQSNATEEDFLKAVSAFNEVILHGNPTSRDLYHYVCLYDLHGRRDMEKAINYCYKIIADGEQSRDAYWFHTQTRLSLNLVRSNRANEAIQFQKNWLEREPNNYLACTSVAFAYHFASDYEAAYEYIKRAEKMHSNKDEIDGVEIDTGAGDICRSLKKYDEAIEYWDKAYEADTGSISCLFSKAEAYEEMGELTKAIETYQCIKNWLSRQGYDSMEHEYPNKKIRELSEKCN
ncbi:MAG: hypothetical protein K0S47_2176 [Herbinix sp.]|nr:hypothetical protein [Herbinix sp.]